MVENQTGMTTQASIKGDAPPTKGEVNVNDPKAKEDFNSPEPKETKTTKKQAKKASSDDDQVDYKAENEKLRKELDKLRTEKEEKEENDRLKAEIASLNGEKNKKTIFIKSNGVNTTVENGRKVVKGSVNGQDFSVPVDQSIEVEEHIAEALQPMIDQQNANRTTAAQ